MDTSLSMNKYTMNIYVSFIFSTEIMDTLLSMKQVHYEQCLVHFSTEIMDTLLSMNKFIRNNVKYITVSCPCACSKSLSLQVVLLHEI